MYQRIVITAGISLLTNRRKKIEEFYPEFFTQSNRITEENEQIIDEFIHFIRRDIYQEPFHEKLSAEISMITALKNQNKLHKHPEIIIFYTDTIQGVIAATILAEIIEKQFSAKVSLKKIIYVDVTNRHLLTKSLGYFLSDVSNELLGGVPSSTCFAPIGGYKIFTSLGYLVGAFLHYPTAYLHEGSFVLHLIPPVKIQIDETFIEKHHRFLRKMLRETIVEVSELTEEERHIIEKEPTFFTVEEDLVELNPFGQFLCNQKKFAHYFQPKVSMEQSVSQEIEKKYQSYKDNTLKEIYNLIVKHRDFFVDYEGVLFHEKSFSSLRGKELRAHLFKGGNHPVFRAIWQYDEKEDRYYIGKIWFDHDVYERQAEQYLRAFNCKKMTWVDITKQVYSIS